MDRVRRAAVLLQRAADAGVVGAWWELGVVSEELARWRTAEHAYGRAIAAGDRGAVVALHHLLRWHGDPARALEVLQEAARGGDADAASELADAAQGR